VTRKRRGSVARGGKGGFEPRTRIRERELQVAELAAEGRSQHEISRLLGISQAAASKILKRLDERWIRENQGRIERNRAEQTRKLEHLYRQALQAWEASKAQRTRRRQRKTDGADGETGRDMAELIVDDSHGDPRYLEVARKALADLARVSGVAKPGAPEDHDDEAVEIILKIGDERTAPRQSEPSAPLSKEDHHEASNDQVHATVAVSETGGSNLQSRPGGGD
jgi:predicted transcriptional regulator